MKKFLKITGIVLGVLLVLICGTMIALQIPAVQKKITDKVIASMGGKFDGDISIGSISVLPFSTLIVKDVLIRDIEPFEWDGDDCAPVDTFAYIGYAAVKLDLKSVLKKEGVLMKKAIVKNAEFNLTIEPNLYALFDRRSMTNLQRIFNLEAKKIPEKKPRGRVFEIEKVEVENFIFRMKNYKQKQKRLDEGKPDKPGGIDWDDLELITDFKGHSLGMEGYKMHGTADHVEIYEKSGMFVDHIEGSTIVGEGETRITDLLIRDQYSNLVIPSLALIYGDQLHFNDFIRNVRIVADVAPSTVDLGRTIGYFSPGLLGNPTVLEVERGGVDGPVCNLGLKNIQFKDRTSGVSATLDGLIGGLPETKGMDLDFSIKDFRCNTTSLTTFIHDWAPNAKVDLSKFAPKESFTLNADGKGTLDRLNINGSVKSTAGDVRFNNLLIENLTNKNDILIGGRLATDELNVGKFIGNDKIGALTMTSGLQARLGKAPVIRVDSLSIRKLHAMGYNYSNIRAQGIYSDNEIDGRIVSHDPNLDLMAQGIVNLKEGNGNSSYDFYVNLGYADLGALKLFKNGELKVALNTDAKFARTRTKDLIGDINITDVILKNENGSHRIGDISVQSHFNDKTNRMKIDSDFCEGSYVSSEPVTSFVKQLVKVTTRTELPVLYTDKAPAGAPADYKLGFRLFNTRKLLDVILPAAYVEDNTRIDLDLTKEGALNATVRSGRLAIGENYLKDLSIDIDNKDGGVNAILTSSELCAAGMKFRDAKGNLYMDDNLIGADIRYDNQTEKENKGDISLIAEVRRAKDGQVEVSAHALPSSIFYEGNLWRMSSDEILIKGKDIKVDRFKGLSADQTLLLSGGYSQDKTDTLSLRLEKFDISPLNGLLGDKFGLGGRVSGNAVLTSPAKGMPGVIVSLGCDSTRVSGYSLGHLDLESKWDAAQQKFRVSAANLMEGRNNLRADGWITRKGELDIKADLDSLNIGYAKPILASLFSTFEGGLSGTVRASGSFKDLRLSSENTELKDVKLGLDYTKVCYTVNGPVSISEKAITFNDSDIKDSWNGTGKVSGSVFFNTLKDISVGVLLKVRNMRVLDTKAGDDPSYYGKLDASGTVDVHGPLSNIGVDIIARSTGPGEIHIPLNNSSGEKRTFLTFYQPEEEVVLDEYERMMNTRKKKAATKTDLDVSIRVITDPEVKALIEVDKSTGNILTASGNGDLDIAYNSKNNYFGINGNYVITSGNYQFNALEIINKTFTVREGGTIRFNGDIMDTDLDIDALYTTKASLSKLLSENETVDTRRTVECGFKITDKLRNPQIKLSINVPNLDPTTQAAVEAALNTEDKIQKQFLYLLISGSFMPSDISGIVNNSSDMLYSNVSNIMSNQINNIFEKLDIPLDLGLNYKATELGNDIFDVAVTTELFHNRVVVGGAIGNREYATTGKTTVVGDIDIDIKIDRQGNFRVNLFSHSADQYSNYLDNSQRSGGGISYQREFNTFKQFFRTMFQSRKRRQEDFILEGQRSRRVTLNVDENGNIPDEKKKKKKK